MKKILFTALMLGSMYGIAIAQPKNVQLKDVTEAEDNFAKQVSRKGIKEGYLSVLDADAIVFRPEATNATEFFNKSSKIPGKLSWTPKVVRMSANGDLAFTAGPFTIKSDAKNDEDNDVYGEYVSIWRKDINNTFKLIINLTTEHPEPESEQVANLKDPDFSKQSKTAAEKDPFLGKNFIMANDKVFNSALDISSLSAYKEFLVPEGRYYFPGFEPLVGQDKILKFINNQAISIAAETISAARSSSGDLAYSYGKAKIKKGGLTNQYNYVRIWEVDQNKKWNILLEIFSPVE
jgi:ketosteroid isomerase-like protein